MLECRRAPPPRAANVLQLKLIDLHHSATRPTGDDGLTYSDRFCDISQSVPSRAPALRSVLVHQGLAVRRVPYAAPYVQLYFAYFQPR